METFYTRLLGLKLLSLKTPMSHGNFLVCTIAYLMTGVLSTKFIGEMRKSLDESKQFVLSYNPKFIKQRKIDYRHLWSKGAISLDDEQQTAIVTDDKYNLVVAAAGSGKTEVLITRIAYLIQRKPDSVQPNRILAIATREKLKNKLSILSFQSTLRRYNGLGKLET